MKYRILPLMIFMSMASGFSGSARAADDPLNETPEQRDARMAWWREARFGMFIHWGLYSGAGGTWEGRPSTVAEAPSAPLGCWMQRTFEIPYEVYRRELMPKLTGERFDPGFIADLAKDAGMKYVVAVTKHHDGFCMFDSELTDYKITNSPAKRDWIAELADSLRERDLKVGFYYSLFDWAHPDYPVDGFHPELNNPESREREIDFDRYLEYMHGQYRELMTNYGKVDIVWHDFSYGEMVGEKWRASDLMRMIRTKQPHIISNNRLSIIHEYGAGDLGFSQDFFTPEQYIPPRGIPGQDFEVCQTINGTWEYTHYDRNWKSTTTLIRELIDTVSKGGNYLLNIGPKPDGGIPETTIDKLRAMGRWMDVHGESIYGTTASPFEKQVEWGRFTQKQLEDGRTRLYVHMFSWPFDSVLRLPAIENEVLAVRMLSQSGQPELAFEPDPDTGGLLVTLPIAEPNDHATVVMLDIAGDVIAR
jgi:alpha-L-fucosidase